MHFGVVKTVWQRIFDFFNCHGQLPELLGLTPTSFCVLFGTAKAVP